MTTKTYRNNGITVTYPSGYKTPQAYLKTAKDKLKRLESQYGANHPGVKRQREEIANIEKALGR